ncbi:MAG TPA: nitronate monooxygenase [Ignavibacteriaceae bacterium]|nr:nitronate monooxygenase [Ignavibacteriaceae bacterium]
MNINNRIAKLFNIKYPIIQAGMVWVSGWKLVSAVSNCGGLGLIGAGSMKSELLKEHINKCKSATDRPFGVNIPLLRGDAEDLIKTSIENDVKIFFTSAGNPAKFIDILKKKDAIVVHVVPSVKHGLKAESVGCDAIVGEGFEAGGHNGPDEIATLSLIPQLVDALSIPVIAAGGIADGRQIAASFCLGADGVQIGTLFAATEESSAHINYKNAIVNSNDVGTTTAFKQIGLIRMIKNNFAQSALNAEKLGADANQLKDILGSKREQLGIFEGDLNEGALEAGQSAGLVKEILPVKEVFEKLINQFSQVRNSFINSF